MNSAKLRKTSFQWHRKMAWTGLVALLLFVVSAATHPILSWTGPQAVNFRPPVSLIQPSQVSAVPAILARHGIEQAIVVKLLPSQDMVVLQVTQDQTGARRYFDLESGEELPGYDERHAAWLAQYYVGGDTPLPIENIEYITEFDSAYPWVNRLLPVYKVNFADDAGTAAYIYTEINALAGMGNDYKTRMQMVFRNLHTWSWLDAFDNARVIIMGLLLITVFTLAIAGVGLLVLLRGRKNMPVKTRVHRIAAYVVALPLLAFSVSGFWHLLHYGFSETHRGLKLGDSISLSGIQQGVELQGLPQTPLNQVSIVSHEGELFYRLGLPPKRFKPLGQPDRKPAGGEHAHHEGGGGVAQRTARFKGQTTEQGGLYYSAVTGKQVLLSDKQVAIGIASKQLGADVSQVSGTQLIKRFGLHYDFRNKRLPVWQIDFESELGDKVFIDPASGMLVDRLVDRDRYEGYSFSFLHKWNFLTPFIGRFWRDVLVVVILALTLLVSMLGLAMRLTR